MFVKEAKSHSGLRRQVKKKNKCLLDFSLYFRYTNHIRERNSPAEAQPEMWNECNVSLLLVNVTLSNLIP